MLPRSMARSACLTALQLKVQLPEAAQRMLDILEESAWRWSDLIQLRAQMSSFGPEGELADWEKLLRRCSTLGI